MNIKEMEAGPELNALVATEIMDWRWDDDWGCLVPPEQTAKPSEMWTDWKVEWNVDARYYCETYKKPVEGTAVSGIVYNGDMTKIELPDFTGDIAAAWDVADRMLDWNGPFWWDDFSMRSHRSWDCKSWSWGAGFRHDVFQQADIIVEGAAKTAPLAICRAALLAVMEEDEE